MSTYPFGPHGPQSGPNQVTPNPTAAYVPPPMASYQAPAPIVGGATSYGGGYVPVASGPTRKRYWLAMILTLVFGPIGLFYASKKGALIVLFLLFAVPIGLGMAGMLPGGSMEHPFAILDHDSVMDPMWARAVVLSMIWAVVAVWRYNAEVKAES